MKYKNSKSRYGIVSMSFHWLIALLIIGLLSIGLYMVELPLGLEKIRFYGLHKEFGILVLMLASIRILWRISNIVPILPKHMPNWQKLAARLTHFLLYLLMFAMPITGWMLSSAAGFSVSFFGLFVLPDLVSTNQSTALFFTQVHKWLGFSLIGLIVMHAGAAFHHHFIYKDKILRRILP
jgi:cytochrome b561